MTAQDTGYHAGDGGQAGGAPTPGENSNGGSANGSYDPRLLLNSTQIPDVIIDKWMPTLSGGELRVVIYVARRTYGWRKPDDEISVSQLVNGITKRDGARLDYGTGLSRSQVVSAVDSLCEKGVLARRHNKRPDGGDAPSTYSLDLSYQAPEPAPKKRAKYGANGRKRGGSENHTPQGGSENRTRGGTEIGPPGVQKSDPQQSVDQHPVSTTDRIDLPSVDQSGVREELAEEERETEELTERSIDRPTESKTANKTSGEKPWRKLDEHLKETSAEEVDGEALSIGEEIRNRLGVPVTDGARLAHYCSSVGNVESLRAAISATANSKYRHAWPTLLTAYINRASDEEKQLRQRLEQAVNDGQGEATQEQSATDPGVAPPPGPEAEELWRRVLRLAEERSGMPNLVMWFEGTIPIALEGAVLTLAAPNSPALEYIESRFRDSIEDALTSELSEKARLHLTSYG